MMLERNAIIEMLQRIEKILMNWERKVEGINEKSDDLWE